ncbi:MAG TPA: Fur family transcriptional regulator [Terriglobales bacterium]|jgi:Fur family peroxide stress response transcriptional regulator|nr:Fur family transcriptional regulator [Terriglobales bacterium]
MTGVSISQFRELCQRHGLAVTHQRQVIFEALTSMPGHPSPEEVFERVRKKVPAISLATVYKAIHTFLDSGIFGEVSVHHGSLRVDRNISPHHHLVCTRCKSITDIEESDVEPVQLRRSLPAGFQVHRYAVEILGVCPRCSEQSQGNPDKQHY